MVKISQYAFDQIQFIKYHRKEENSLNQFIENKIERSQIQKNSASTEKTANTGRIGRVCLYWPSFFFSILAESVVGMMQADLAIQILY